MLSQNSLPEQARRMMAEAVQNATGKEWGCSNLLSGVFVVAVKRYRVEEITPFFTYEWRDESGRLLTLSEVDFFLS